METLVSSKFQVVIPKKVRKHLAVKPGQKYNVYVSDDHIILSPKRKWPEEHLKDLRNLWQRLDIKTFVDDERDAWK